MTYYVDISVSIYLSIYIYIYIKKQAVFKAHGLTPKASEEKGKKQPKPKENK